MNYLDTSALVKLFVQEKGSQAVRETVSRGGPAATAKIAYAEVHAGLARRRRQGDLSSVKYTTACRHFEEDWLASIRVDLHDEVLLIARELVRRRPLRAFDAIHLASALMLQSGLNEPVTFIAADARLLQAAAAEKLLVLNPEEEAR